MVDKIKKSVPKAKTEILEAYQRNAGFYDPAVKFFYPLIGLRIEKYRRRAVECLNLSPGDTVIDLGCGTGLCFPLLIDKVGPEGLLIGVDMSSEMLSRASVRVKRAGW
ncbi:MAG: methyltransferase domain-containing protein, partial [Gammaproteobacteria bacterium]